MRPALSLVLCVGILTFQAIPASADVFHEGRTTYSRDGKLVIPFELRAGGPATSVKLFVQQDGGAWQEYDSAKAGSKREFSFRAEREGIYGFATMTTFSDGTSDPSGKDRLYEQRRLVYDRTPPKVNSIRATLSSDGAPGIEWDVTDENIDSRKGVTLEFRWPDMGRFEPIDKNVPFGPRDQRHWQLRNTDRMQVRVVAIDKAGNRAESEAVWVSTREADRNADRNAPGELPRANPGVGNGGRVAPGESVRDVRDTGAAGTQTGLKAAQAALFYVNDKERRILINTNVSVGQSGLKNAHLWAADEKLEWKVAGNSGERPAVEGTAIDRPRYIPISLNTKVDRDGLFNFIVIAENHRGTSRRDPRKGDPGEIQVIVDSTPPLVEILSTKVSQNGERGAVVDIRWKATDANMAPVPIMLEYCSPKNRNDWKAITPDWIDNTGQHSWTAPTGEGYEFFVRVKCKDRAGNEAAKISEKAVNTDLAVPSVEYKDVLPGVSGTTVGNGSGSLPSGPPTMIPPNR